MRMVRTLRAELGTESVRSWVRQADVDKGHVAGVSAAMVSFFSMLQNNVLNCRSWATRDKLGGSSF